MKSSRVLLLAMSVGCLLTVALLSPAPALAQSVWYVNDDATGIADGHSWGDAFTDLQSALAAAQSGDQIWVASGTYVPTAGGDRAASFGLVNGVTLYGGFAGTEATLDERDHTANETVLSGEIGNPGVADNSYHVVAGAADAVVDGFVITGGNADGPAPNDAGGGLYQRMAAVTLVNVTFTGNFAAYGGGMALDDGGTARLTLVTFYRNSATAYGGMWGGFATTSTLVGVTFAENAGGGMFAGAQHAAATLRDVIFSRNGGNGLGIGMDCAAGLTNVTFSGNDGDGVVVGLYFGGIARLMNVTSTNNGGVAVRCIDSSTAALTNCILWGDEGGEIALGPEAGLSADHCLIQGGYAGPGNVAIDPRFVDAGADDLRLRAGSPAIDSGTGVGAPSADLDGVSRPMDGDGDGIAAVDMGAYEYSRVAPVASFVFSPSTPSIFDMVLFVDTSTNATSIKSWSWDFGDGATSMVQHPSHRYAADGDYMVRLTVISGEGHSSQYSQVVRVRSHDVGITTMMVVPKVARVGQAGWITIGLSNRYYRETVRTELWKSVNGGAYEFVGAVTQSIPTLLGRRTAPCKFSYTFTAADLGTVTFKARTSIVGFCDCVPSNDEMSSSALRVLARGRG